MKKRASRPPQRYTDKSMDAMQDDYTEDEVSDMDGCAVTLDPSDMVCNTAVPVGYKRKMPPTAAGRASSNKRARTTKRGDADDMSTDMDASDTDAEGPGRSASANEKLHAQKQKDAEKRAKQREKQQKTDQRKKREVQRAMQAKQKEALDRMKRLQSHPRVDMIDLVPVHKRSDRDENGRVYSSETACNKRKLMRWQITMGDGQRTTFPGVTNVLNSIMYSDMEPCKYSTTSEDAIGYEANKIGNQEDTIGRSFEDVHEDVCGLDNETANRKDDSPLKCIGRGREHGTLVHEQVSDIVRRWIQEYPAFPNEDVMRMLNDGTLDPCVYKIVTLLMKIQWTPIMSEYYIYDETLRLATAVDLVCMTHAVQRLAFVEIKTSTRKDALDIFMNGDTTRGRRPRYMQGMLDNHVLDTGRNRAAMQLMATEAIMCSSYTNCRPHSYQIIFVSSEMPEATLITLPEWCWDGANGQLGMNRRIIYNMLHQHASHIRLKTAARAARGGLLEHNATAPPHELDRSDSDATDRDAIPIENRSRANVITLVKSDAPSSERTLLRKTSFTGRGLRMMQHAVRRKRSRTTLAAQSVTEVV